MGRVRSVGDSVTLSGGYIPRKLGGGQPMETVDIRPRYETPQITPLDRDEVLQAFQMTAAQISAAGCWWAPACAATVPCAVGNPM